MDLNLLWRKGTEETWLGDMPGTKGRDRDTTLGSVPVCPLCCPVPVKACSYEPARRKAGKAGPDMAA